MKIAASSGKPSRKVDLIIPLADDEEHHKLTKENSLTWWEPRTVPGDANSPTYKVQVRILSGSESVRQMIRWKKDLEKLCTGLNATTLATMKPIMIACMRPRVETLFEATLLARAEVLYNEALEAAWLQTKRQEIQLHRMLSEATLSTTIDVSTTWKSPCRRLY